MNLIDFIKMANGLDEKNLPKSTAIVCLTELSENENNELVSNIKQMVTLLTPEIKIDYFTDSNDDNGYIEVRVRFDSPNSNELRILWNMLEKYRELNYIDDIPIDTDIEIKSDTIIEMMIVPREISETDPIFLELAFPINFNLCSGEPGKIADTLDFFFNVNGCLFHENDYIDIAELSKETDDYVRDMEVELRKEQEYLEEQQKQEEENLRKQMDSINQTIDNPEEIIRIRLGGKVNEKDDDE